MQEKALEQRGNGREENDPKGRERVRDTRGH